LCIWNAKGEPLFTQTFDDEITVLQWLPDSRQLLVGDTGGGLCFLNHFDTNADAPDDALTIEGRP
jgi:hypothetical protein